MFKLILKSVVLWTVILLAISVQAGIQESIYFASSSNNGPGWDGCTGAPGDCTDRVWGVDLGSNTGFKWALVGGSGGMAYVYLRVSGSSTWGFSRSMGLYLNREKIGAPSANVLSSPRPYGSEVGPFRVMLRPGKNVFELVDSEDDLEFDIIYLRIQEVAQSASEMNQSAKTGVVRSAFDCDGFNYCKFSDPGVSRNKSTGLLWTGAIDHFSAKTAYSEM